MAGSPEKTSIRDVADLDELLSQPSEAAINAAQMVTWIADWVGRGGETWAKPTHFEERAGRF
jgi:hypothetical protein